MMPMLAPARTLPANRPNTGNRLRRTMPPARQKRISSTLRSAPIRRARRGASGANNPRQSTGAVVSRPAAAAERPVSSRTWLSRGRGWTAPGAGSAPPAPGPAGAARGVAAAPAGLVRRRLRHRSAVLPEDGRGALPAGHSRRESWVCPGFRSAVRGWPRRQRPGLRVLWHRAVAGAARSRAGPFVGRPWCVPARSG